MRRDSSTHNMMLCGTGPVSAENDLASENPPANGNSAVPDFVEAAMECGVCRETAEALKARIQATGREVRARKLTPAGGERRIARLCLAVSLATAVLG